MFSLFILFIIIIFKAEARDNDPVEITFKIHAVVNESAINIICDHAFDEAVANKYTVLEGEEFNVHVQYTSYIHHLICHDKFGAHKVFNSYLEKSGSKELTNFKAERQMGTIWNCTVLVHRDHASTFPKVQYKDANYTVAYCFMKIHVRLRESPQTILVNNMELETVRTDLSEKDIDSTAEYHYADGDVANVTCFDFLNPDKAMIKMQYAMADTTSDDSSINRRFFDNVVGFITRLHSGHNNSYMTCFNYEYFDNTKAVLRFVMRTEFNIISVRINGMTVRPRKTAENHYNIKYYYESLHPIKVVCEVQQTDVRLTVLENYYYYENSYKKTDLIPTKKSEMTFYLNGTKPKMLECDASYYITGAIAEKISISFSAINFPMKQYSLHITSSNGRSMNSYGQQRLIYYEYNDGETLQLTCGPFLPLSATHNISLHFGDSDECSTYGCALNKTFKISRQDHNNEILCYLKGYSLKPDSLYPELVQSEIKVVLRARVLTTSPVTALTSVNTTTNAAADPASSVPFTGNNTLVYWMSATGVVTVIIIFVIVYLIVTKRCCCIRSTSQELPTIPTPRPDPATVFYENLLSVFRPINEQEAMEMENHYEVVE